MIKLKPLLKEGYEQIPSFDEIWKDMVRSDRYRNEFEFWSNEKEDDSVESVDQIESEIKARQLDRYQEIVQSYRYLDGELCWREITLDKNVNATSLKNLGIYWAIEEEKAEAHHGEFGKGHEKITFEAVIDEKIVDWRGTIFARMDMSIGDEEAEIRFFPKKNEFF